LSIAIGIPISRLFDWRTVHATHTLINDAFNARQEPIFIPKGNHERFMPISRARNEIAQTVVDKGIDYLLFLDSDATLEQGTLTRLLSRNVPMVSALCFKRRQLVTPAFQLEEFDAENFDPYQSIEVNKVYEWIGKYGQLNTDKAYMLPSTPEGSLIEVDRCGTHCLLIHRSVLEAVEEPRFMRTTAPDSGATGSDYYFCNKAREAGFPIYVDMSVISGHLNGSHIIAGMDFMMSTVYMNKVRHNFKMEKKNGTINTRRK